MSIAKPNSHGSSNLGLAILLCSSSVLQFLQIFLPNGNLTSDSPQNCLSYTEAGFIIVEILTNEKHLIRNKDSLNFQAPVDLQPDYRYSS